VVAHKGVKRGREGTGREFQGDWIKKGKDGWGESKRREETPDPGKGAAIEDQR